MRWRTFEITLLATLLVASLAAAFAPRSLYPALADTVTNAVPVDVELVLAVDISYSMDPDEQALQREGYVLALTSREFMQALLESDGHEVDTAVGVSEAMERLQNATPPYEVLVTDIGLSDGSGWDLTTFARGRWPSMRIGVVTGWEPKIGAGAEGDFILRKPVRTSELLAQVAGEG